MMHQILAGCALVLFALFGWTLIRAAATSRR